VSFKTPLKHITHTAQHFTNNRYHQSSNRNCSHLTDFRCIPYSATSRSFDMSKAREIIKNNKAKTGIIPYMGNWAKKFFSRVASQGHFWGTWVRNSLGSSSYLWYDNFRSFGSSNVCICVLLIFLQLYANSRQIGWFIVSTGMITALPLILEVSYFEMLIGYFCSSLPKKMLLVSFCLICD
jgi:hypothetical protein